MDYAKKTPEQVQADREHYATLCVFCDYCGYYWHMNQFDGHYAHCSQTFLTTGRHWPKLNLFYGKPKHLHAN